MRRLMLFWFRLIQWQRFVVHIRATFLTLAFLYGKLDRHSNRPSGGAPLWFSRVRVFSSMRNPLRRYYGRGDLHFVISVVTSCPSPQSIPGDVPQSFTCSFFNIKKCGTPASARHTLS